jgi:cob(I)alamin adenosyltransferase
MNQGMIHVYCGNGKGKTSILNGMTLRALGANLNVKYFRFLKNRATSENTIMAKIGIEIENHYHFSTKFIWEMNDEERATFKAETRAGFAKFAAALKSGQYDVVLADEILGTVENQFITEAELIDALNNKAPHVEVALSGRKLFHALEKVANLISEVNPLKHYFDEGTNARLGIEY